MCPAGAVALSTSENLMAEALEMSMASNICELKFLILAKSLLILNKLTSTRILLLMAYAQVQYLTI